MLCSTIKTYSRCKVARGCMNKSHCCKTDRGRWSTARGRSEVGHRVYLGREKGWCMPRVERRPKRQRPVGGQKPAGEELHTKVESSFFLLCAVLFWIPACNEYGSVRTRFLTTKWEGLVLGRAYTHAHAHNSRGILYFAPLYCTTYTYIEWWSLLLYLQWTTMSLLVVVHYSCKVLDEVPIHIIE